ncbi:Protein SERAC1 [Galdieria sulphuraria]|nr:Protein SERAC1 [Galdieria sulphuraria]
MDWLYHDEFCKSNDMLQLEVLRAIANMQSGRKWKYPNGIFLIYPTTRMRWEPQLDIVLVHGLLGGPLRTWRVAHAPNNNNNNNNAVVEQEYYVSDDEHSNTAAFSEQDYHEKEEHEKLMVWPRDWLSKDIPNIRILSVSYDTSISAWRSYGLPLKHQAADLLEKLCDAGIGSRPCVIITHSYGGLVMKQAIVDAVHSMNDKYLCLVDSIRGLVFFSTPHLGSPIVGYLKRAIVLLCCWN